MELYVDPSYVLKAQCLNKDSVNCILTNSEIFFYKDHYIKLKIGAIYNIKYISWFNFSFNNSRYY